MIEDIENRKGPRSVDSRIKPGENVAIRRTVSSRIWQLYRRTRKMLAGKSLDDILAEIRGRRKTT
jgi:hypothetical protein